MIHTLVFVFGNKVLLTYDSSCKGVSIIIIIIIIIIITTKIYYAHSVINKTLKP